MFPLCLTPSKMRPSLVAVFKSCGCLALSSQDWQTKPNLQVNFISGLKICSCELKIVFEISKCSPVSCGLDIIVVDTFCVTASLWIKNDGDTGQMTSAEKGRKSRYFDISYGGPPSMLHGRSRKYCDQFRCYNILLNKS